MKIEELNAALSKFPGSRLEPVGRNGNKTIYKAYYKGKTFEDFRLYEIYLWLKSEKSKPDSIPEPKEVVVKELDLTDEQAEFFRILKSNIGRRVKVYRNISLTKTPFVQEVSGEIICLVGNYFLVRDGDRESFVSPEDIVQIKIKGAK